MAKFVYPVARRNDSVIDDYHGTKIVDPYRWLEDPDSEETKAFVDAQNAITLPFLEQCPFKKKIHNRVTEMVNYARYSCPAKHGDSYYYTHNTGLQNQSVLYVQDSPQGDPRVFLDPNKLSEDGTVALIGRSFSEDGKYFTYGLSQSGSDWVTIKFKMAPSGEDLPDVLVRVKFSCMAWTHDNKGIFYNCYPEQEGKSDGSETTSNLNQKLFYHRLGTSQSEDVLVMEIPDNPRWLISAELSDCGNYVILSVRRGCEPTNKLFYVDLKQLDNGIKRNLPYVKLIDNFDAEYEYITNEDRVFTFRTNLNAPKYKLINIDLDKPEMDDWVSLVDEDVDCPLEWAACANHNKLILCYMRDVKNELYVYDLTTGKKMTQLALDVGTVVGYSGKKKDTEIFYQFLSFLTPGVIYRCDITQSNLKPEVFREIKVKGFDFSQYETKQVFYKSTDGMKVPMFIIHRKGISLDGSHPTLLYGYGGFNISLTPSFSVSRLVFAQHLHGVLAIPNIRGGGEYGETWHKGGTKKNKQNVFNDFQCAAEYLISEGYTSRTKLIINGGSNGGLLVGACVNQRPDLFACAISQVGVMDMLRFHKFTIGHAWTTDYGCSDECEQFDWLMKYSPLHNICAPVNGGQYPAILLLTADHDDRVVPLHSLKYIAQLQEIMSKHPAQTNPLLIRIDTKAGHGAGKPISKSIDEMTDIYCYVVQTLNLQWTDY